MRASRSVREFGAGRDAAGEKLRPRGGSLRPFIPVGSGKSLVRGARAASCGKSTEETDGSLTLLGRGDC